GSSWNNGAGQCKQGPTLYAWEKQQTCGVGGSPATSLAGAWVAGYDSQGEDVNGNEELDDPPEDVNGNGILDQGCIYMAIRDFCSPFYDPGVIDPASPVTSVADEHFPNLPAILMEIALQGQLREPIATLNGYIKQTTDPEGLIDDFAADIRIGAMQYNQMGTRSECDASPKLTHRLYDDCPASSQDGAKLIAYMDNGTDHTARLVQAINDIKANTWTPIAEAYYEALGYFTQQDTVALDMRFDDDDFLRDSDYSKAFPFASVDANYDPVPSWLSRRNIATAASDWTVVPFPLLTLVKDAANKLYWTNAGGTPSLYQRDGTTFATDVAEDTAVSWVPVDPVTNYCQKNNILIITDGGSTVDVHPDIISKIGDYDAGGSENAACGNTVAGVYKGYYGSTYLDDLAKYAYAAPATTLYKDGQLLDGEGIDQDKQNITTYVVTAGKLRVTGTDECSPDVLLANTATNGGTSLYASEDPEQLEANLRSVMESIRAGTASGSASSVISASRGGEGAIYQAIFWPRFTDEDIVWIGDVHSMFIDSLGKMYEDTDSDGKFDDDGTDKTVVLYYDESLNTTMACNDGVNADRDGCLGTPKALNAVNYLWSAAEWLSGVGAADITAQRADADYISHTQKRYIHTWIDLDNNGVADLATEWIPFVSGASGPTGKAPTPPHAISVDFAAADSTEVENIIDWVRGDNTVGPAYRDRERNYSFDSSVAPTDIIWRLGDVIHSTPMAVTRPSEGFHMLYGDDSYAKFAQRYNKRRHVIYFGSNDGILHAVNGGFYDSSQLRFCVTADCYVENDAVKTPASENKPELGAELWAYVPYNILPHLKCLTSPSYEHKYFVDLRPRIFDVQIFLEEAACSPDYTNPACFHPGGWGTIMVAGMRFGGAPIDAWTIDGDGVGGADQPTDLRKFISSYMVFDITDPEHPPTFLGELTDPDKTSPKAAMGYATVIPTVIPMYDNKGTATTTDDATYWYLVLGSGPTELSGKSEVTQFAKLAIYPLNQLTNGSGSAFMIPNNLPSTVAVGNIPPQTGVFTLPGARSFVSDPITVDFDLKENYMADAVYFGTVSGDFKDTGAKLGWGGKFYRLVTRKWDGSKQVITLPSDWDALLSAASLDNPAILADIGQPIVASPTVGSDRVDTWVYIGTGRFFDEFDKSDSNSNATQTFYGIKEPRVSVAGEFTWGQVALADLVNTSLVAKVASNANPFQASIYCINPFAPNVPGDNCPGTTFGAPFPGTIGAETFQDLVDYIKIKAGWKRNLKRSRERNLGQGTLLGGLLTFTTYQPFEDKCLPEGLGYLYGVYYGTGTAFHTGVFGDHVTGDAVQDVVEMGRGLSTTPNIHIGKAEGGKAFAQTSTGAIIEIPQPNLPLGNVKTGRKDWQELWQ
ncbi:MAG: hypothetical protein KKA70_08665, partial [Proteobacteria bacterium]|nr:hypothetical protein [Pseudomonadota bacterium]